MAGFDAGVVKPLDYKGLGVYGIEDGVVAEPTNEALVAFLTAVQDLRDSGEPAVEGEEAKPALTGEEALVQMHQACADLCSGTPSAEQFAKVPPRVFKAFVQWLAGEFTDPKD